MHTRQRAFKYNYAFSHVRMFLGILGERRETMASLLIRNSFIVVLLCATDLCSVASRSVVATNRVDIATTAVNQIDASKE